MPRAKSSLPRPSFGRFFPYQDLTAFLAALADLGEGRAAGGSGGSPRQAGVGQ